MTDLQAHTEQAAVLRPAHATYAVADRRRTDERDLLFGMSVTERM